MDIINYGEGPFVGSISTIGTACTNSGSQRYDPTGLLTYAYRSGLKQYKQLPGRSMIFGAKGTWGKVFEEKRIILKQISGASGIVQQASTPNAYFEKVNKLNRLGQIDPNLPRGGSVPRIVGGEQSGGEGDARAYDTNYPWRGGADISSSIDPPNPGRYDDPASIPKTPSPKPPPIDTIGLQSGGTSGGSWEFGPKTPVSGTYGTPGSGSSASSPGGTPRGSEDISDELDLQGARLRQALQNLSSPEIEALTAKLINIQPPTHQPLHADADEIRYALLRQDMSPGQAYLAARIIDLYIPPPPQNIPLVGLGIELNGGSSGSSMAADSIGRRSSASNSIPDGTLGDLGRRSSSSSSAPPPASPMSVDVPSGIPLYSQELLQMVDRMGDLTMGGALGEYAEEIKDYISDEEHMAPSDVTSEIMEDYLDETIGKLIPILTDPRPRTPSPAPPLDHSKRDRSEDLHDLRHLTRRRSLSARPSAPPVSRRSSSSNSPPAPASRRSSASPPVPPPASRPASRDTSPEITPRRSTRSRKKTSRINASHKNRKYSSGSGKSHSSIERGKYD